MRHRQSLAELDEAFHEELAQDRIRREEMRQQAAVRARQRQQVRKHRGGTYRFAILMLSILATAVLVTVVMFRMLALWFG